MRALLLATLLVAAPAARAADPSPTPAPVLHYAWELDVFAGYGQVLWPGPANSSDGWWNGGPAFAVDVAYRGDHFTHPFVDLAWIPMLNSGQMAYNPGNNTSYAVSNGQNAIGLTVGVGWDVEWFRARAGVGVYDIMTSTTAAGVTNKATSYSLGFLAALAANVWRPDPFALGIEARLYAFQSPTAGIFETFWQVGLTGRWDFVRK